MSHILDNPVIDQLIPLLADPSFENIFEQLTENESDCTRFLIKMELNRLMAPCMRNLDLREQSDIPCDEITHQHQCHFLNEDTKAVFVESLALYQDKYTLGVYERVIDSFTNQSDATPEPETPVIEDDRDPLSVSGVIMGSAVDCNQEPNHIQQLLQTTTGLGLERIYLPHLPHLPLFISQKHGSPFISHILLSHENQSLLNYFVDESDKNQLAAMLTSSRLEKIIQESQLHRQLIFSFTHNAKGKTFFYSATQAELEEKNLSPLFFGFGAKKAGWKVFQIHLYPIEQPKYKVSVLPKEDENIPQHIEHQLERISHIMLLIDCTDEQAKTAYQHWDQQQDVNELKIFGQPKIRENQTRLVSLQFSERRTETRFTFKTLVRLTQGNIKCEALSQDISSKGLQLTLDRLVNFDPHLPITISFPRLQSLAGKTKLEDLPYKLIRVRKNGVTLHLMASVIDNTGANTSNIKDGMAFLHRLIEHNKNKLAKQTDTSNDAKELANAMKNLLMKQLDSTPYFIHKTPQSSIISALGINQSHPSSVDIFKSDNQPPYIFDLNPLLGNDRFSQQILNPISQMKSQHKLHYYEVFIKVSNQSEAATECCCKTAEEIGDRLAQIEFIKDSKQSGHFLALRIYLGAASKPDLSYIQRELKYLNEHAPEPAKQLQQYLCQIAGVGEFLDITDEVKMRYPELNSNKLPSV